MNKFTVGSDGAAVVVSEEELLAVPEIMARGLSFAKLALSSRGLRAGLNAALNSLLNTAAPAAPTM